MPNISIIPVDLYQANDPYHYTVDNRPIESIVERTDIVNNRVDTHDEILTDAMGSTGSLANRINVSFEDDGTLKVSAVDDTMHSIASHTDGDGFVRMTDDERSKLSLIQDESTNLNVNVEVLSSNYIFPEIGTTVSLRGSDTINWRYESEGIYADSVSGLTNHVIHLYDITPVLVSSDLYTYKTTSIDTPYKAGTLRVYVNGLRLTQDDTIGGYYYVEDDPESGVFMLSDDIGANILRIDFDQPLS